MDILELFRERFMDSWEQSELLRERSIGTREQMELLREIFWLSMNCSKSVGGSDSWSSIHCTLILIEFKLHG